MTETLKNIYEYVKYIAVHSPVTYGEARMLFPICMVLGIKKEEVAEDLVLNGGDVCILRREYLLGGGR